MNTFAAALRLADHGIAVFPCVPGEKRPLTRHGLHDATTDVETIRAWWRRHPDANLAMPTGAGSFDVLDVDVHAAGSGFPAFNELIRTRMISCRGQAVTTPSGGMHLYFRGSTQPSSSLPDRHIDFKAMGG